MVEKPDNNSLETENKEVKEELSKKDKKLKEKYEEEIAKLKADSANWKNEYYRAYADMKNLRNSLEQDHQNAMKYRAMGFVENLLPILDSFHFALGNEPEDPVLKNYLVGFQYIYKNFLNVLNDEGVIEISPNIGDEFDDKTMNAVEAVEDEGKENIVLKVNGKGYKLHDRLVRPAMVVVSKKKTENKEKTDA